MIQEIRRQKRFFFLQTAVVFAGMVVLLLISGLQVLGATGLALAVGTIVLAGVWTQQQASAVRPTNASQISRQEAPELFRIVEHLSHQAGLSNKPAVYALHAPVLNAATLGSVQQPLLVVTPMLARALTVRELSGVLAHELSHIRHRDLAFFRIVEVVSTITIVISRLGWLMLLLYLPLTLGSSATVPFSVVVVLLMAPLASVMLQLGLSRSREYAADLGAIELTEDPDGLASALQKIDNIGKSYLQQVLPVPRQRNSSVFRTHPPTAKRVERLHALSRG